MKYDNKEHKFNHGDSVRMKVGEWYYYGEVTIVREEDSKCKVMFNDADGPDYDYYPQSDLELVEKLK